MIVYVIQQTFEDENDNLIAIYETLEDARNHEFPFGTIAE